MLRADPSAAPVEVAVDPVGRIWLERVLLVVATGVLVWGFGDVVQGRDWWFTTMTVVGLVCLAGAVLRSVGSPVVMPVTVVVWVLTVCWVFVSATLWFVLPTPDSARALGVLIADARTIILEERAPVANAMGVVLVIAASLGLVALLAEGLLVERHGVLVLGALWLSVFCTPALVSGTTPAPWQFVAVAAVWLVLLRSRRALSLPDWRAATPAVAVAAGALAIAASGPVVSPDISAVAASWGKPPPSVFGTGINPMLHLGQNLRRNSSVRVLTYTTTMDSPPYLKVATLREFNGKTWHPSRSRPTDRLEGVGNIHADVPTSTDTTSIQITNLRSTMLPVPYPIVNINGLEGSWRVERFGMTVRASEGDTRGQSYVATSVTVDPSAERMRQARAVISGDMARNLQLPPDVPQNVLDAAAEVTANASTGYDKALALQRFFRDGDFSYSETAPVAEGYDGNGVEVLGEFLERKEGYCVHFSSAMAVMARAAGLPARIAVGYAPGQSIGSVGGETTYAVTSDNLHAWTEIHFEGIGWVGFEPTPGVGSATRFSEPAADLPDSETGPALPGGIDSDETTRLDPETGLPVVEEAPSTTGRALGVAAPLLLMVVAGPALVRQTRRRLRWRRGAAHPDVLWREVEDTARDLGRWDHVSDTPRQFAAAIARTEGIDPAALDRLLGVVEVARFARPGVVGEDVRTEARAIVAALSAAAPTPVRLRAVLLPRSLAPAPVPAGPLVAPA